MGREFRIYLAGESVFLCKHCGNHLAVGESVLSKVWVNRRSWGIGRNEGAGSSVGAARSSWSALSLSGSAIAPLSNQTWMGGNEADDVGAGGGGRILCAPADLFQQFTGQHGRAMLIRHAVNIYTGDAEEREMRTGRHTVRDVFCKVCHAVLGWKYDFAYEPDQKYKEGRFILEREMVTERPEPRSAHARATIEEHLPVRELMARV